MCVGVDAAETGGRLWRPGSSTVWLGSIMLPVRPLAVCPRCRALPNEKYSMQGAVPFLPANSFKTAWSEVLPVVPVSSFLHRVRAAAGQPDSGAVDGVDGCARSRRAAQSLLDQGPFGLQAQSD